MSEHKLPDFVTPIPSGMEPCTESDGRLSPERQREVLRRLREFDLARARALASSHGYVVR